MNNKTSTINSKDYVSNQTIHKYEFVLPDGGRVIYRIKKTRHEKLHLEKCKKSVAK